LAGRSTARLRRLILATALPLGLAACGTPGSLTPAEASLHGPLVPAPQDLFKLVAFSNAPFPFHGRAPGAAKPFMDVSDNGRLGHSSLRNGVLWEDQTYSDRRSLLYLPRGFDPRRPALMVVFLHGNEATLERDVLDRQGVARQFLQSGLNAVLVAPQLAFDARDSSAGRFWEPGFFRAYLHEAAVHVAELYGVRAIEPIIDRAPVVLVAYSGGYLPAAYALKLGSARGRVRGLVLLDALYGEQDTFGAFVENRGSGFFVSAFSRSSRDGNLALESALQARQIPIGSALGAVIPSGSVTFIDAGDVTHGDFVTQGFTRDPLAAILSRIPGYGRASGQRVADDASAQE
jgi:hypothetical protein